jgi:hypothetical protein
MSSRISIELKLVKNDSNRSISKNNDRARCQRVNMRTCPPPHIRNGISKDGTNAGNKSRKQE